jgi:hypothetical protein
MKITGRTLRPTTMAERRMLLSLGVSNVRVPRHMNPYAVGRRMSRLARGESPDADLLRKLVARAKAPKPFEPSPGADSPDVDGDPGLRDACAA